MSTIPPPSAKGIAIKIIDEWTGRLENDIEPTTNDWKKLIQLIAVQIVAVEQRAEAAERCVKSIATMLGWMNVPPQSSLEANIRENRERLEAAERERDELRKRVAIDEGSLSGVIERAGKRAMQDRDELGRQVRTAWIEWARLQPQAAERIGLRHLHGLAHGPRPDCLSEKARWSARPPRLSRSSARHLLTHSTGDGDHRKEIAAWDSL